MSTLAVSYRRVAVAVLSAGAALFSGAGTATAAPGPGCTAADIAAVESQVAAAVAGYFFTHPEVNNVFTSVHGMPSSQAMSTVQAYLAANPQTQAEIDAVRSPVQDLRNRCNIPPDGLIRGVLME
jgi:hemophore-related protein